ncbi:hypothetical protein AWQ22_05050 [Picosynechococcus sp. PCC 7117]|nr:hypothetical protein AWQ22_05050 [Picosynechococcus sp. PCC 7117]
MFFWQSHKENESEVDGKSPHQNNGLRAGLDSKAMTAFFSAGADNILASVAAHTSPKTRSTFLLADGAA